VSGASRGPGPRLQAGILAAALALGALAAPVGPARAGDDVCPEPNDSAASSCPLGSVSDAHGYLDRPDDQDRYRIEVGEGQTVQATLGTLPAAYGLRLESSDGSAVATASGGGTDDRVLGASGLSGGTYYLVVYSEGGDSNGESPYVMRVSVVGAIAGGPVNVDPDAPPPPPPADRPLDQLVLNRQEAGEEAKDGDKPAKGKVDGAEWYEVTYKRDASMHKRGPLLFVNRVYRADDVGAAQRIFQQQAGPAAGLPEAKARNYHYKDLGNQLMNIWVGEEAQAVGAVAANTSKNEDVVTRHYRIVLRMGSLVETIYTYGPDTGNTWEVAFDLAKRVEKRVKEAPAGPPPEIFSSLAPEAIGLRITDTGNQTTEVLARSGSDERARWYESRYDRGIETYAQRLGPVQIYNKVFVASSNAAARELFQEHAVFQLPEATEVRGAIFPEPKTRSVGNESYAIGACNNDCGDELTEALHERIVFRRGNVVVIIYIWGHENMSNPDSLSTFAESVNGRIR
jgi:hypothetical protein